jgi:hypothetical protein
MFAQQEATDVEAARIALSWFHCSGTDFVTKSEETAARGDSHRPARPAPVVHMDGDRWLVERRTRPRSEGEGGGSGACGGPLKRAQAGLDEQGELVVAAAAMRDRGRSPTGLGTGPADDTRCDAATASRAWP